MAPQGQLLLVAGVHTGGVFRLSLPRPPGVGRSLETAKFPWTRTRTCLSGECTRWVDTETNS